MEISLFKTILEQIEAGSIEPSEFDAILKIASISEAEEFLQASVRNQIKKENQLEKTEL